MKTIVKTSEAPSAIGPYSQAVKVDNFVFTAGQIAINPDSGEMNMNTLSEEVNQIMKNLCAVAKAAGTSLDGAIKTTIFLTDLALFAEVNQLYAKYFSKAPPARSTVGVSSLPKGANVEIEMVLYSPQV